MPSHSHNSTTTRGPRPRWWTTLAAVLLFVVVFARLDSDEPGGAPPEQRTPTTATESPAHGGPMEVRPGVFESPAGLIYGPGSTEGHRIDHILRHADDDPDRPVHGVFDGNREEILALLDEAYRIASRRGPPVDVEQDGDRIVYTIDMGRRVGYVGGEAGERDGHPAATHLRLVLEGRDVITAFPLNP